MAAIRGKADISGISLNPIGDLIQRWDLLRLAVTNNPG
jgi:hypothetical protein